MNRVRGQELAQEVPKRLAELLAVPLSRIKVEREPAAMRDEPGGVDMNR